MTKSPPVFTDEFSSALGDGWVANPPFDPNAEVIGRIIVPLRTVMVRHAAQVVEQLGGHRTNAAKALGISRGCLRQLLKEAGTA